MTAPKEEKMESQCWICPECHDDHSQEGPCTPKNEKLFMPRSDDNSYIAKQYRSRVAELAARDARLAEWQELHEKHAALVIPGETDSADAYRRMYFEMKAQLAEVIKSLEFYADKANWDDDQFTPTIWDDGALDLGKRARDFLAKEADAQKKINEVMRSAGAALKATTDQIALDAAQGGKQ